MTESNLKDHGDISNIYKKLVPDVHKTNMDIETFNPKHIRESLSLETSLEKNDVDDVVEETIRRIIVNKAEFLSGPHIREIVCSVLSSKGLEDARKEYTRIGMAISDYEFLLENGDTENANQDMNPESIHHWAANRLSTEYSLLRLLSSEESKAHLVGDIHVHMLRYFDLRPFCQAWDPRLILENGLPPTDNWVHCSKSGPAGSLRVAVTHLAKWLGIIQGEFSGGQGYDYVTTFLAPYARGLSDKEINQSMQCLIFETNQIFAARGGQVPFTSISCTPEVPDSLKNIPAIGVHGKKVGYYGDYNEECLKLFDSLTEVYTHGDHYGKLFPFPKHEVKVKKKWLEDYEDSYIKVIEEAIKMGTPYFLNMCPEWMPEEIHSQCCRKFLRGDEIIKICDLKKKNVNIWENYVSIGSLQSISLNLPRYSYLSENEDEFFRILSDKIELSSKILLKKKKIIERRIKSKHLPLCSGTVNGEKIFDVDKQNLSVGFVGLNEAVAGLTNFELHGNEYSYNLGKRILEYMVTKCNSMSERDGVSYSLWEQPAESTANRFARLDLKYFPEKAIVQSKGKSAYYTNSSHIRYDADIPLSSRIKKQGDFHPIVGGGVITHIWLGESIPDTKGLFELTKNICLNTNTAYFSYTTDFSYCTDCSKMHRGIKDFCPDCKSVNLKLYSRITGYYSEVDRYNSGKLSEWRSRKREII